MKHELKATSRLLVPFYIALFCISIINHLTFNYGAEEGIFALLTGFLFIIQHLFIMAIVTGTAIFMIIRFYKNFLSDEGYLMFTLPVSIHQLILSKLIIALFWTIVSAIGAAVSWAIVISSINDISLINFSTAIMKDLFVELNAEFGFRWVAISIELIVLGILFLIGNILLTYASIAIGQLFKKYKIIASFGAYVVITTVLQFVGVAGIASLGYIFQEHLVFIDKIPSMVLPIAIIIGLVGCAIFYVSTYYIFKRKLNLD